MINDFLPTHGTISRQLLITAFYRWDSEAQRSSDITKFIHGNASPNPTAGHPKTMLFSPQQLCLLPGAHNLLIFFFHPTFS